MMQRHSHVDGGADQCTCGFAHALGDDFCADGVCTDQACGAVLLSRTNGENDAARSRQIILYLWPSTQVQQHIVTPYNVTPYNVTPCPPNQTPDHPPAAA